MDEERRNDDANTAQCVGQNVKEDLQLNEGCLLTTIDTVMKNTTFKNIIYIQLSMNDVFYNAAHPVKKGLHMGRFGLGLGQSANPERQI